MALVQPGEYNAKKWMKLSNNTASLTYFHRDAEELFTKLKQEVDNLRIWKVLGNISGVHSTINV